MDYELIIWLGKSGFRNIWHIEVLPLSLIKFSMKINLCICNLFKSSWQQNGLFAQRQTSAACYMIWSIWVHLLVLFLQLSSEKWSGKQQKTLRQTRIKKIYSVTEFYGWNKLWFMSSPYTSSCLNYFHSPETCQCWEHLLRCSTADDGHDIQWNTCKISYAGGCNMFLLIIPIYL